MSDAKADLSSLISRASAADRSVGRDWNPTLCGEFDLRIARSGTWYYEGSPIRRSQLVALFASILRRERDGFYYLVTSVEKLRIQVDCLPFIAVEVTCEGSGQTQILSFRTNVGESVVADAEHPIVVTADSTTGEPLPSVRVRDGLSALLTRSVYYELVELGEETQVEDRTVCRVWSCDRFFELGDYAVP